jgi:hypothetical protein
VLRERGRGAGAEGPALGAWRWGAGAMVPGAAAITRQLRRSGTM